MKNLFLKVFLFLFFPTFLVVSSCSDKDKGMDINCEMNRRSTQIKIRYVNDNGEDLFFSSSPTYSIEDLNMYQYFDGKDTPNNGGEKYKVNFTVEGENPQYLLVQGSPENNATFFIQMGDEWTDEIHFKGSIDKEKPCPENKVDELSQNGTAITFDQQTGIWKLLK